MTGLEINLDSYVRVNRDIIHKLLIEITSLSPAKKRKVGAILVDTSFGGYTALVYGYNYNPDGGPCETEDNITHENVIHAEVACIENIPKDLTIDDKVIMLVTHPPCDGCKAALKAKSIKYKVMGDFLKFDSEKPRVFHVPGSLVEWVGKVVTYGISKYKINNWRKAKSQEPYINAMERHLIAIKKGEMIDEETGLPHVAHIACNASFLLELQHLPLYIDNEGNEISSDAYTRMLNGED